MTEQEATNLGRSAAHAWCLSGTVGGKIPGRTVRAVERILMNQARDADSPLSGRWWMIEQECAALCRDFDGCRHLPALRQQGRSPRIQILGEALARGEVPADRLLLTAFLGGVQSCQCLTEQELALLISAWKLGLLLVMSQSQTGDPLQSGLLTILEQLRTMDLRGLAEELSAVHAIFAQDAVYLQMDRENRAIYRRRVAKLARGQRKTEVEVASQVMDESRQRGEHIGFLLFPEYEGSGAWYPLTILLATAAGVLAVHWVFRSLLWTGLAVLPVSQLVVLVVDFLVLHIREPRPTVRLELPAGIPPEGRTLAVIAAIVPDKRQAAGLARKLEGHYLRNRSAGEEARFGVLADLPDRMLPPDDVSREGIRALQHQVEELNRKYGERFYLLFRESVYQAGDECYRGWERKRGALMTLIAYITGKANELEILAGDGCWLRGVRYLLTLDSDTRLNMDSLRRLTGTMLHPLNRAVVNRERKMVTRGYGILQPRIGVSLGDGQASRFAGLFGGEAGTDPYHGTASDLYQDGFQAASYCGKGMIDVHGAALCLTGRFPQNRVLSHDLLEGAFLRAGLAGDVELTDGFPRTAAQFLRRQHRWIRGDWQAAAWIWSRVPLQNGEKVDNPLRPIDRWKLLDNLRRSLLPVGIWLSLLMAVCVPRPGHAAAGALALLALAGPFLSAAGDLVMQRGRGSLQRFHSAVLRGLAKELLAVPVRLFLLPAEGWTNLRAVVTALYRLHVSHKKLLEWVPSGLHERQVSFWRQKCFTLPCVIAGAAALLGAGSRAGALLGVLWLVGPLVITWLDRPSKAGPELREEERTFLLRQGELMWQYFEDHLTEEFHYLPPDNVQEVPDTGAAPRTSPTNIGLALLSCLAAVDLGLAPKERVLALLDRQLTTVEGLERERGHLYNWYDIRTTEPLYPRYISTVDSGNLCAALIALEQGLRSMGEAALAQRAGQLAKDMDFAFLYDRKRELFFIGYDAQQGCYTQSWYDLLASEARQTSYLAVARGEAPYRHWQALNRACVTAGGYAGLVSWTGTMFEYFMPHLLLPAEWGTLIYESLAFCAAVQKQWGTAHGVPWGVSESGCYALNQSQSYRYKAHGVPTLALSRDVERERVVTPYAAFLALPILPHAAVKNLKRLRELGMEGKWGLYEAVDFTPRRTGGEAALVRSWMVHHLGMSLLAIDNALRDDIMIRRFLANPEMDAARELLEERVPTGVPVMGRKRTKADRRKPMKSKAYQRQGTGYAVEAPACHLLSEGESRLLLFADGGGAQEQGEEIVLEPVEAALELAGNLRRCFPAGEVGKALEWRFTGHDAALSLTAPEGTLTQRISLRECGVLREFTLEGGEKTKMHLTLTPVLDERYSYEAHRAFSRLGLEWEPLSGGLLFRRRSKRGKAAKVLVLLWEEDSCHAKVGEDGVVQVEVHSRNWKFAAAYGALQEARAAAEALLLGMHDREGVSFDQAIHRHGFTRREAEELDDILSCLHMPRHEGGDAAGQSALWPYGISGDDPLWVLEGDGPEELDLGVRQWLALRELGARFDLALLVPERNRKAVCDWLSERTEPGGSCGVHVVAARDDSRQVLHSMARLLGEPQGPKGDVVGDVLPPLRPLLAETAREFQWKEHGFCFTLRGNLGHRRWTHVLANPEFGYLADECGTGHLWYQNARENKLTPWQNDPLALSGPETLAVVDGEQVWELFAREDGVETVVTYGPGWARWERQKGMQRTSLTAAVPLDRPFRLFTVQAEGFSHRAKLRWTVKPLLSDRPSGGVYVTARVLEGGVALQNPANERFPNQTLYLESGGKGVEAAYRRGRGATLTAPMQEQVLLWAGMEPMPGQLNPAEVMEQTEQSWLARTSDLTVWTPEESLNHYLNFWSRYQVLACRLYARCGLYQCGGAYGFRDQLQDAANLLPFAVESAREQILRCCAHQYEEGDVMHWWHPLGNGTSAGVRTRISDDLLWLPWAVCRWCSVTGDQKLLQEQAPFLTGRRLEKGETSRFERAAVGAQKASVFDHCVRALECALGRGVGAHGLLLMGSGDWNDGMDRLGEGGKGESVWLTWFASGVLRDFAALCSGGQEQRFRSLSKSLAAAAKESWDGEWYRRAYSDEGVPVGSVTSPECQIDSIAQSFSVFAPNPDPEQGTQAVRAAIAQLYDREHQIVKLLSPAFAGALDAGYISAYPAGVRENGGQYTHGAVWLAMAALRIGETEPGWNILRDLLPENHDMTVYQGEPYVLAGDVSAAPGREGRGGWTWYTGAAGWYYRAAVEELLGLQVSGGVLHLRPRLPKSWEGYRAVWRHAGGTFRITVTRGEPAAVLLNGSPAPYGISMQEWDGEQEIRCIVSG